MQPLKLFLPQLHNGMGKWLGCDLERIEWKCIISYIIYAWTWGNFEYYTIPKYPIEKFKTIELLGAGDTKLEYANF